MEKDLDMAGLNEAIRKINAKLELLDKPKVTKKSSKKK
jgi:hypothetical protein